MADPDHVPDLDGFDELTVRLYRSGLLVAALGVLGAGLVHLVTATVLADIAAVPWVDLLWLVMVYGIAAAVLNLHLYDKRIRWLIRGSAWLGMVLLLAAGVFGSEALVHWTWHAGVGFLFVTLSGFALKEQYCFRLPLMRLVPVVLAVSLIPLLMRAPLVAGVLLTLAGTLLALLAVQKMRMPLHYDIGDKSQYQT